MFIVSGIFNRLSRVHFGARFLALVMLLALVTSSFAPHVARAASSVGNGTVGNGTAGSCNEATLDAALAVGGYISFNCPASTVITVTSMKNITQYTYIDGSNNGNPVTISGGNAVRILSVNNPDGELFLYRIIIADGYSDTNYGGGAILGNSYRPLTAYYVTFQNNHTPNAAGGAILAVNSPTFIENTLFDGNTARWGGGAIATNVVSLLITGSVFQNNTGSAICTLGPTTIDSSTFTNNTSSSECGSNGWNGGGAIMASDDLTVTNSRFTSNHFLGGSGPGGGAISLMQNKTLIVSNTTFDSNTVVQGGVGGAIASGSATLIVTDSDFRFNEACSGGAIRNNNGTTTIDRSLFWLNGTSPSCLYGNGGALLLSGGGSATIMNSVFYLNHGTASSNNGGAVFSQMPQLFIIASTFYNNYVSSSDARGGTFFVDSGNVTLQNTILAGGKVNGVANNCETTFGAFSSLNYNIADDNSCNLVATSDLNNTDPKLAAFQEFGSDWGLPLLSNSPAYNRISLANCANGKRDYYNRPRPEVEGTNCDVGAIEGAVPAPPSPAQLQSDSYPDPRTSPYNGASQLTTQFSYTGEPVNTIFGNFTYEHTDFEIPARGLPVRIMREYNSAVPMDSIVGFGWSVTYDLRVSLPNISTVALKRGSGRTDFYTVSGETLIPPADSQDQLVKNGDNSWTLTLRDGSVYQFDPAGRLVSVTDLDGNRDTLSYNSSAQWTGITDAAGRAWALAYNGADRLSSVTDSAGRTVSYAYDGAGNLTSVTNALGAMTTYTYDGNHRLTSISDPLGHLVISNSYDGSGRVVQQSDARGGTGSFTYMPAGTIYTDALGAVTKTFFNSQHKLTQRKDALNRTTPFAYNSAGLVKEEMDALGGTTTYIYDARGNPTTITDPLGNVISKTYNPRDQVLTTTDPRGNTTTFTYDAKGHLTSVGDALNNITNYTYNSQGLLTSMTNALLHTTTYAYDAAGNRTSLTNPLGKTTTFTHDAAGRITAQTDPLGHTTSFTFDALGRLLTLTAADGGQVRYTYDAAGNQLTKTDALGHVTPFAFNDANDLVSVTNALGQATTFQYDALGRRTRTTQPNGQFFQTTYDAAGQAIRSTTPLGFQTNTQYDGDGRVTQVRDAAGDTTHYTYDADGRLTRVTDALGNATRYTYDTVGNLLTSTDARNNVWTLNYDALNRAVSENNPLAQTHSRTFNAMGQISSTTNGAGQTLNFGYDNASRLTSLTGVGSVTYGYDDAGNRVSMNDGFGTTTYSYDNVNRVTAVNSPQGNVTYAYNLASNRTAMTQPGASLTYAYDVLNRLTGVSLGGASVVSYGYDIAGRLSSELYANGLTTAPAYDNDNRLTGLTTTGVSGTLESITYMLDPLGNRLTETSTDFSATYSYDHLSQLTGATVSYNDTVVVAPPPILVYLPLIERSGAPTFASAPKSQASASFAHTNTYAYTYDAVGNRLSATLNGATSNHIYDVANRITTAGSATFSYDAAGHLTSDGTNTYAYDARNNLTSITGSVSASYAYDGDGNRVSETAGGAVTTYLLDRATAVAVHLAGTNASGTERYVYGLSRVLQISANHTPRYEHQDGLGNVRVLSSATGAQLDRVAYAPFGARLTGGVGGFGFTGEAQSDATGLVHLGVRDYSPALGRFLTEDPQPPLPTLSQSINRYAYAFNNPVNLSDRSGKSPLNDLTEKLQSGLENMLQSEIDTLQFEIDCGCFFDSTDNIRATQQQLGALKSALANRTTLGGAIISTNSANLLASTLANVISNDGNSLISQDGGTLAQALSNLISQDGGTLVGRTLQNLISQDGGTLISQDGGTLLSSLAASLISQDGGTLNGSALAMATNANDFISHNGSALLSDNGAGLISDNGYGLVGNSGGTLVAQGGGN